MRDRIERAFAEWGHLSFRHAWLVIVTAMALTAGLASQLPRLTIDTSTESFLHESDPIRVTYEEFRHQFGRDDLILIAVEPPDVFSLDFLDKLRRLHREIEDEVPKIEEVTSLVNARETRGEGDELIVGDLLEDWPRNDADLQDLRRRVFENPLYLNTLVSSDGRLTTILIKTDTYSSLGQDADAAAFEEAGTPDDADPPPFITSAESTEIIVALRRVLDRYRGPDFKIYASGAPILTEHLTSVMQADMGRFTVIAVIAIALLLGFLFHRLAGVVLPLLIVAVSVIWTMALMPILGTALSLPTQILPSFLLAVGVGNSLHILAIFYQRRRLGDTKERSIAFAMGHSALAILMTSLTTAGGLVSFAAAELAPISDFGVFGPIGVMIALVLTIALLPALIAVWPMNEEKGRELSTHHYAQRLLVRVGRFATRHAWSVVIANTVLVALALWGAFQINFGHDPIRWFPEKDYFRISTETLDKRMAGHMFLEVVLDTGEENGLHDPVLLQRMDEFGRYADSLDINGIQVGKTISLADIVKEINQALNENRLTFRKIPADRALVAQELLLFENSGTDDLEDFVDTQFREGRITMKLPFTNAVHYPPFIEALEQGLRRILGDDVRYTLTGLMSVVTKTITAVIYSMATSYFIAFLIITPLMVLLIGNLRLGLASMIPNLSPIVITLGVMGWTGIALDAFTLLVGSIAIGLAVDDTIHFMHNFRRYAQRSDVHEAVAQTLSSTGQAMMYTSLVLSVGFFLYMFATMQNLFYFGLLTGFTIVVAFLEDVILAPALMALLVRSRPHGASSLRKESA